MSICGLPFPDYTKFDAEFNALMAQTSKLTSGNNSTNGNSNPMAANTSIFDSAKKLKSTGKTDLIGFDAFGSNGSPALNIKELSSLSTNKEAAMVGNIYSSAVDSILNLKIPPLPKKKAK